MASQPVCVRTPDGTLEPAPWRRAWPDKAGAVTPIDNGLAVAVGTYGWLRFASWTP